MTIAEAAREVLRREKRPMTVDEIYEAIIAAGLAEFKAAQPRGVLRNQIRRHCKAVPHIASAGEKYFKLVDAKTYFLIED